MNEPSRRKRTDKDRIDRVTTRSGDDGGTSLADGRRYRKQDVKIDLAGTLDEANSFIGLLAAEVDGPTLETLATIQSRLFDAGAVVATATSTADWRQLTLELEAGTAVLNEGLPPLREFILPGGGRAAASAHVARAVVRRAERAWWRAADEEQALHDAEVGIYLNRLSDYLFVLARTLADSEQFWRPIGR